MQENQILVPSWIKAGCFIDLKDKQGEWRVAYILNVTKTQIRVRYDGFSSKFDEVLLNICRISQLRVQTSNHFDQ